jgi:putative holliday junction resolvase
MKILAVDPGEKRIGLAISDPTGTIARPLCIIKHEARQKDTQKIVEIAHAENVEMIVVGQALDAEGEVGHQARKAGRLAEALREKSRCSVKLWDESGTTRAAIMSRVSMGVPRKKRKGHLDDVAASIMLQDFLIANEKSIKGGEVNDDQT